MTAIRALLTVEFEVEEADDFSEAAAAITEVVDEAVDRRRDDGLILRFASPLSISNSGPRGTTGALSYTELAEHRPCATCGKTIQPGQLYIAKAPFHIGCAPRGH